MAPVPLSPPPLAGRVALVLPLTSQGAQLSPHGHLPISDGSLSPQLCTLRTQHIVKSSANA